MRTYLLSGGETSKARLEGRWLHRRPLGIFSSIHKTGQIRFFPKAAVR